MKDLGNGYVEIENAFLGKVTKPIEYLSKKEKKEFEKLKKEQGK